MNIKTAEEKAQMDSVAPPNNGGDSDDDAFHKELDQAVILSEQ